MALIASEMDGEQDGGFWTEEEEVAEEQGEQKSQPFDELGEMDEEQEPAQEQQQEREQEQQQQPAQQPAQQQQQVEEISFVESVEAIEDHTTAASAMDATAATFNPDAGLSTVQRAIQCLTTGAAPTVLLGREEERKVGNTMLQLLTHPAPSHSPMPKATEWKHWLPHHSLLGLADQAPHTCCVS